MRRNSDRPRRPCGRSEGLRFRVQRPSGRSAGGKCFGRAAFRPLLLWEYRQARQCASVGGPAGPTSFHAYRRASRPSHKSTTQRFSGTRLPVRSRWRHWRCYRPQERRMQCMRAMGFGARRPELSPRFFAKNPGKVHWPCHPSAGEGFDLDLPGPLVAAGFADQARRARGRTPRVFRQYKDVLSKNPTKPANPARSAGRNRRGVLSFGYLFFAQAKKSNSLAAASETAGRAEDPSDCFKEATSRSLACGSG
jgi:hypothetical protein